MATVYLDLSGLSYYKQPHAQAPIKVTFRIRVRVRVKFRVRVQFRVRIRVQVRARVIRKFTEMLLLVCRAYIDGVSK
jgi:hypothetical protein